MSAAVISGEAFRLALAVRAEVGESPVWSAAEQRLYWVDIQNEEIHRFDPATGHDETFELPEIVTSIGLRAAGGLIATLKKDVAFYDPASGALERIGQVEAGTPHHRFNDGKCGPGGRYFAGTMDAKDWSAATGHLFRVDSDRSITQVESHVVCSNGTDWSPDSKTVYYTESLRYSVFAYDFEPQTGAWSNRRAFVTLDEHGGGFPDGLTVDAEGFVWSNVVGLGQIRRYDPAGKLERTLQLPVPRATSCAFGGHDLRTLFITTARETMSTAQLAAAPLSGSLFAYEAGVRGQPAHSFAG